MSKRGMATQGGEERYGGMGGSNMQDEDDKPRQATAAQLARRKILSAKGTRPGGSNRGSRAGSPAVAGSNPFAQTQTFQPPPSANGFNFSVGGLAQAPAFGQSPQTGGNLFGTPAQDQAQQNGGTSFGGFGSTQGNATPSFGSAFGSNTNDSQPNQNGFNPGTSFNFGQSQNNATTPATSFSFGQAPSQPQTSQQPETNGFKPAINGVFGNSFGGSHSKENGTMPTFSFGQSQPATEQTPKPSAPSFGSFGQSAQANGEKAVGENLFNKQPSTGLFGSTPAPEAPKTAESIFSAIKPTTNGIKPGMFTQSQQNGEQTPKPFSFGQTATKSNEETPKPTFSFGQSADKGNEQQTPKPASNFVFGQPVAQHGSDQTPKPSNMFGGFSSKTAPDAPSTQSAEVEHTPKASASIFSGFQQPKTIPMPTFNFGATQSQDTSMMSPENTPQKQGSMQPVAQSASATTATPEPQSGANAKEGRDLFSRISRAEPPATAPRPSFAPKQSFGQGTGNNDAPSESANNDTGKDLFSRLTYPEPPATEPRPFFTSSSKLVPNTSSDQSLAPGTTSRNQSQHSKVVSAPGPALTSAPDRVKLKQLNEGFLAHLKDENPRNDWSSICQHYLTLAAKYMGAPTPKESRTATKALADSPVEATHSQPASAPSLAATSKAPANNIFNMQASSGTFKPQMAAASAETPMSKKRPAEEDLTKDQSSPSTEKRNKPNEPIKYPTLPETASKTAKLFASTLDKSSEPSNSASLFSKSTPSWDTPKLSSNEFPAAQTASFGPPQDVMAKVREQKAAKEAAERNPVDSAPEPNASTLFKPSTTFTPSTSIKFGTTASAATPEASAEAQKAPTFGFKPSTSTANTTGFKPPSFAAASDVAPGSFLAAFGKKASADEEKARKRRKAEEYDSEEEDEAAWEAKDKAEQEAKRRKIEEAAKSGPSFTFPASVNKPTASSTPFAFKLPNADTPAEIAVPASAGESLFDRLGSREEPTAPVPTSSSQPSLFSSQTPKSTGGGFTFGQPPALEAGKTPAEKQLGFGDNTWKPETPIKFGGQASTASTTPAAPPPSNPFGGLFGSNTNALNAVKPAAAESGKLAPPTVGFNFGQKTGTSGVSTADASRATTPGVTTDGEASTNGEAAEAGEPSDEAKDQQIEDMTALLPEELEAEEVIAQASLAKASKYDDKNTEDGVKKAWIERGKGPLYVLKNKTTGKVRILLKVPPLGRLAMNFEPLKGVEYKSPRPKFVTGPFIDHLETNKEKAPGIKTWQIQVKDPADAEKIAKALMDGRPS